MTSNTAPKRSRGYLLLLAILAVIGLGVVYWQNLPVTQSVSVELGKPFKLAATTGSTVDSESLKGKPYGMLFGFTHCPEVCPTTLYDMTQTYVDLGDVGKDFHLYFVSIDPERDTVDFMKNYLANFDPRIIGLIPTLQELPDLAKAYRVFYEKVPSSGGEYTMNHTATVFLFGADGKFRATLAYGEKPEIRVQKLRALIEGK
jgi:protein SCO1/2